MFENYSIKDFFANLYKNKIIYLVIFILSIALCGAYLFRGVFGSGATVVTGKYNYSTYYSYKIEDNRGEQANYIRDNVGGLSDFYRKLVENNLNGVTLFKDVSDEEMDKISEDLQTDDDTLRNSNKEFWEKKIKAEPICDNTGVSISILTTSKMANEIMEKNIDKLIDSYKNTFEDVKITKLQAINSGYMDKTKVVSAKVSKKSLAIKGLATLIFGIFVVSFINLLAYIFRPTINSRQTYIDYGIDFVFDIRNKSDIRKMLEYIEQKNGSFAILTTNKKVLEKFKKEANKEISISSDIEKISNNKKILFIEEYGKTRIREFQDAMQNVYNFESSIVGVASYKL